MNKLRIVLLNSTFVLLCRTAFAGPDMEKTVIKAAMEVPEIKKMIKRPERYLKMRLENLGIPETYVTTTFMLAKPLIDGKISTKELKTNLKITKDSVLRPDIEYNFKNGETSGNLKWEIKF